MQNPNLSSFLVQMFRVMPQLHDLRNEHLQCISNICTGTKVTKDSLKSDAV